MDDSAKLKADFLRDDFRDSLKWLIVGAITWYGNPLSVDKDYLRAQGLFTSFIQARALYDFFYGDGSNPRLGENARARHFLPSWNMPDDPNKLYSRYMAATKPAQRRVFHLVYGRDTPTGGSMGGGTTELNERVLDFTKHLIRITRAFAAALNASPEQDTYRELVECALAEGLKVGHELAKVYGKRNGVPDPL